MVAVTGKFLRADDTPEVGYVRFSPLVMAVDDTPDVHFTSRQTVTAELDETGAFNLEITASDDSGWRLSPETMLAGGMPYRVLVSLTSDREVFTVYVPDGPDLDLSDLVDLDAVPTVITVPTPGPENVLTIGDVVTSAPGSTAEVTIEGDSPEQVLNFTLPRGETGPANTLTVGAVTTGAPGSSADVDISGTAPNQVIDFTIPRGDKGEPGDPNVLTIGNVTTGAPGTNVDVDISGTAPNQVIDFTIPRGNPGYVAQTEEPIDHDVLWYDPSEPDESEVYLERSITAGNGLLGGGTLVDDLTLEVDPSVVVLQTDLGMAATLDVGITPGTVAAGDDARLSDARTPIAHAASHAAAGSDPVTIAQSQVTNLTADLALKAPLASPTLTGTVTVPTPAAGSETTVAASTEWAAERAKVGNLLTANQASVETNTTGFGRDSNACGFLSRSTAQAFHGSASLLMPFNNINGKAGLMPNGSAGNSTGGILPVTAGVTYTVQSAIYSAALSSATLKIRWYSGDGTTYISESSGSAVPVSTTWRIEQVTAVAPANATYAAAYWLSGGAGDAYSDAWGFWAGAGGNWAMPGVPITNLGTKVSHPNVDDVLVQKWDSSKSRWQTIHYDSGWRAIATWGTDGVITWASGYTAGTGLTATAATGGYVRLRRIGTDLIIRILGGTTSSSWAWTGGPPGFVPSEGRGGYGGRLATPVSISMNAAGTIYLTSSIVSDGTWPLVCTIPGVDAIPTSLPGTLVSAAPA